MIFLAQEEVLTNLLKDGQYVALVVGAVVFAFWAMARVLLKITDANREEQKAILSMMSTFLADIRDEQRRSSVVVENNTAVSQRTQELFAGYSEAFNRFGTTVALLEADISGTLKKVVTKDEFEQIFRTVEERMSKPFSVDIQNNNGEVIAKLDIKPIEGNYVFTIQLLKPVNEVLISSGEQT